MSIQTVIKSVMAEMSAADIKSTLFAAPRGLMDDEGMLDDISNMLMGAGFEYAEDEDYPMEQEYTMDQKKGTITVYGKVPSSLAKEMKGYRFKQK